MASKLLNFFRFVLQIVVEESVLKSLLTQWEQNHEPASLAASHKLATENFCRLKEVANTSGEARSFPAVAMWGIPCVLPLKPNADLMLSGTAYHL